MDYMSQFFGMVSEFIQSKLPLSPFAQYIDTISGLPYLGYLNWFFLIGDALAVMATWLGVVSLWYGWGVLLRFFHFSDG